MESVLRPEQPGALALEQPALFGPAATGTICTIEEGGRVVAAAGCVARAVATPRGRLRIGLIGCVATHPDHRRRGHGAAATAACERQLASQHCFISMLWADVPDFYKKHGYAFAGEECLAIVPPLGGFESGGTCRRFAPDDLHDVERIRLREPSHSDRSRAESLLHYTFPGAGVFVFVDSSKRIAAYLARGRGEDLHGVVHETGGTLAGIVSLLKHVADIDSAAPAICIVSTHRRDLLEAFESSGIPIERGPAGMAKLIDRDGAAEYLRTLLPAPCTAARSDMGIILRNGGAALELCDADIVTVLMGGSGAGAIIQRMSKILAFAADEFFPLSPAFAGFDSI
jgi:GNAT superfamily N-acetyltransferase